MAAAPTLAGYLPDLGLSLKLDWNGLSFQGLPALRLGACDHAGAEAQGTLAQMDTLIAATLRPSWQEPQAALSRFVPADGN